jgi:hypothetical protein
MVYASAVGKPLLLYSTLKPNKIARQGLALPKVKQLPID